MWPLLYWSERENLTETVALFVRVQASVFLVDTSFKLTKAIREWAQRPTKMILFHLFHVSLYWGEAGPAPALVFFSPKLFNVSIPC